MIVGEMMFLAFDIDVQLVVLHGAVTPDNPEPHDVQTPALVVHDTHAGQRVSQYTVPLMPDAQLNVAKGLYDAMDEETRAEFTRRITGGLVLPPGVRA